MAFQIKSDRKETETKSIRFPLELIDRIDKAITDNDVSFSGFVIQACEYALDNMKNNQ
ncbi:MAG: YlcI/YnfO family protein [Lachnospiraceae bacterium]